MVLLYVPFPSRSEAELVSRSLVSGRLIACSNIFESLSLYSWNGKVVRRKEFVALMKTTAPCAKKAKKAIAGMHSYKIPCILELSGSVNRAYAKWVSRACNPKLSGATKNP